MKYNELDVVLLKNGSTATILEVYDNGTCFLVEIERRNDSEITEIKPDEINRLIYKQPV